MSEKHIFSEEIPIDAPQCAFHPDGMTRCTNQALFAIVVPKDESFWYYPTCDACVTEAGELVGPHFMAHLFGVAE